MTLYNAENLKAKLIYEVSYFFYMKVPKDFEPACMSMTEDDHEEFLRWIDVNDPIEGVKHFVTDERPRED